MREQLIDANVASLDAVLITHEHADHTHGMDDLRPIYMAMRRRLDIHVDATTAEALRRKFGYIFETPPGSSYPPMAEERRIRAGEPIVVEGAGGPIEAIPFVLEHGDIGADAPLFNHRRIGAAGRRLEDVTKLAPQRFGRRRVDMNSETSPHRHVDRPEIVDAVSMVGVLVADQHGVEASDVRVDQLLAQVRRRVDQRLRASLRPVAHDQNRAAAATIARIVGVAGAPPLGHARHAR